MFKKLKKVLLGSPIPLSLGQWGEQLAQKEYRKQGYKIVGTNIFNKRGLRLGEIDFIVKNKTSLVFVEVKTRTAGADKFGTGQDAVNIFKQRKILKAVKVFLGQHKDLQTLRPQIDVCLVEVTDLDKQQYYAKIITNAVEDEF